MLVLFAGLEKCLIHRSETLSRNKFQQTAVYFLYFFWLFPLNLYALKSSAIMILLCIDAVIIKKKKMRKKRKERKN